MSAIRSTLIATFLVFSVPAHAQLPKPSDAIKPGTRVWVSPLSMNDRWQRCVVVEERLHELRYLVKTDQYRDREPQTVTANWLWVKRLTDECKPPQGTALIGAGDCKD